MEKILELIGLNMPCNKLRDFEINLQLHYLIGFGIDIGLFVFGIIFAIRTRMISGIIIFCFVTIGALMYHLYALLQLLGGQVFYIEGECTLVDKNMWTFFKTSIFGTSKIEVLANNHTYVVPVSHRSKFREGTLIRIYFTENNVYKKDEDTYDIPYPVYVTKIKNSRPS